MLQDGETALISGRAPVDPSQCPICNEKNACGIEQGASTCWCMSTPISPDVLERVPADLREVACICERCATTQPGEPGSA